MAIAEEKKGSKEPDAAMLGARKVNRELRFAAINLLGTMGRSTQEMLLKRIILKEFDFIPVLTEILINQTGDDFEMKLQILRALNNFLS